MSSKRGASAARESTDRDAWAETRSKIRTISFWCNILDPKHFWTATSLNLNCENLANVIVCAVVARVVEWSMTYKYISAVCSIAKFEER